MIMLSAQEGTVGGILGEAARVRRELTPDQMFQSLVLLKEAYDNRDPAAESVVVPDAVVERFAVAGLTNTATYHRLYLVGTAFLHVLRNIGDASLVDAMPTDVSDEATRTMMDVLTHLRRHLHPDNEEPVTIEEFPDSALMD